MRETLPLRAARVIAVGLSLALALCVCLVWVKKRKEGENGRERGVVTVTGGGGLVGVIKAPDHRTYTQAVHGVTNHSVPPHIINPRRACAARVTAVGSVCLLLSISLLECSFVSQTIRRP